MAEIIDIQDITNGSAINGEWKGTGIFDKLINSVNGNLDLQCESGRITNAEYGTVYSNVVSTVLTMSIDFSLKKRLTELQIEGQLKDNLLKEKQLELTMLDIAAKTYSNTVILVDEHNKNIASISAINKDMDLKDAQIIGSGIDNSLKTKQIEVANIDISIKEIEKLSKQYENEILLIDKHSLNLKEIESSTKEIEVKSQQIASMVIEDTIKQEQNTKDLEVKTQQIAGMVKEDLVKDKQILDTMKGIEVKSQQIISIGIEDTIKQEQNTKELILKDKQIQSEYVSIIAKDKEAVKIGMDKAFANNNANLKDVYTTIYKEVI